MLFISLRVPSCNFSQIVILGSQILKKNAFLLRAQSLDYEQEKNV